MDKDEPKQLKLTNRSEGEAAREKKGKKENEPKGNRWVILLILAITIVISLIFYFGNGGKFEKAEPTSTPVGGEKVYQF